MLRVNVYRITVVACVATVFSCLSPLNLGDISEKAQEYQ